MLGSEYGLALVGTTRVSSPTHQGWVDITLALVLTKFGPDPSLASTIWVEASPEAVCLQVTSLPDDCFHVAWGSEEQFRGQLRASHGTGVVPWPSARPWPYSITFEVPANATRAGLHFAQHRVSLDLRGDPLPSIVGGEPGPAPVPEPLPEAPLGMSGYFLGEAYGLAVVGLSRRPDPLLPGWDTVAVLLSIAKFREDQAFAPVIRLNAGTDSTCLVSDRSAECMRVDWGPQGQLDAVVTLEPIPEGGEVSWPRRKGWPATLLFRAPRVADRAHLAFGDHRIPLDLTGMAGEAPPYIYRDHYDELASGTVLHDHDGKTITLASVEHDAKTGAALLRFSAANKTEANDFTPLVVANAARVSRKGTVFDGVDDLALGWLTVSVSAESDTLAPGQEGELVLTLPRVVGTGFRFLEMELEAPDAVLLQLKAGDDSVSGITPVAGSAYVVYEHSPDERRFWLPDLAIASIEWRPAVPTIGHDVEVTIVVGNNDPIVGVTGPDVVFLVDGEAVAEAELGEIGPECTVAANFTWRAEVGPTTFGALVDPQDKIEEDDDGNNGATVDFGGSFMADLIVEELTWNPQLPSVGHEVTFTVAVRNQGRGRAAPSPAYLYLTLIIYLDGQVTPTWTVNLLEVEAGQRVTATFSWTAVAGLHKFRAVAEGRSEVPEANETNNEWLLEYDATLLADLIVESLTWSPVTPSVGDVVTMSLTVRNKGLGSSRASTVSVFLDGGAAPLQNLRFSVLQPGESSTATFLWETLAGSHTFKAVADSGAEIPESDETNNERLSYQ